LLYLENALENHGDRAEVFKRITGDTFREFQSYARTPDNDLPPQRPAKIKIEEGRILVNGRDILNFPKDMPEKEKKLLGKTPLRSLRHPRRVFLLPVRFGHS
jgi:hypothetical protein